MLCYVFRLSLALKSGGSGSMALPDVVDADSDMVENPQLPSTTPAPAWPADEPREEAESPRDEARDEAREDGRDDPRDGIWLAAALEAGAACCWPVVCRGWGLCCDRHPPSTAEGGSVL